MGVLCKPDKCQCCDCKNTKEDVERRMHNDDFLNEFADFIERKSDLKIKLFTF